MNVDDWEERAAILEFDEGMTRFAAETEAARRQGLKRWEFTNALRERNSLGSRDQREGAARHATNAMSGVQPAQEEEGRSLSFGHVQAGWGGLVLLALFAQWGGVL